MIKRIISQLNAASLPTRLAWTVLIHCVWVACLLALLGSVLVAHITRDRMLASWQEEVDRFTSIIAVPVSSYQFQHSDDLTRVFVQSQPLTLGASVWHKSGVQISSQMAGDSGQQNAISIRQSLSLLDGSDPVGEVELHRRPISHLQIILDYAPILLIGILAASLLLAWVIQRRIHRRLAQPLQQLSERVSHCSLLDEDLAPSNDGVREIVHLSGIFHSMASRLRQHALHDPLTGLPNRLYLDELLKKVQRFPQAHYALLLMDLDHFKSINDNFGHEVGDSLLIAVGRRIRQALPEAAHVIRMGGDEFVVFFAGERSSAEERAWQEAILQAFARPFTLSNGAEVQQHTSGGIAYFPEDGLSLNELLKAADLALYHTKALRTATFTHYLPSMKNAAKSWFEIASALRALANNQDCLFDFQPIVHLGSGQIWGYEMLLRLRDPEGQAFNPEKVVQVAEQINLLPAITERTFNTALAFLEQTDPNINLTINLSPTQLLLLNPRGIERLMLAVPLAVRSRLTIELTEQSLLNRQDVVRAAKVIQRLGYRFALDDFGAGYSALNCLNVLPIYMLKLDKSLAKDLSDSDKALALFHSIIQVAKNLGLLVLVEGVENHRLLNLAHEQQCDFAQGHYIGRPQAISSVQKAFAKPAAIQ